MKCLEKNRCRRYETANGLAMDVQRYLTDEPVLAGPPSATYRHEIGTTHRPSDVSYTGLMVRKYVHLFGAATGKIKLISLPPLVTVPAAVKMKMGCPCALSAFPMMLTTVPSG
jgi:hypothetical protein